MYLVWYDDSPKKSVLDKIEEAVERFRDRFGVAPDQCLVNEKERVEHPTLTVRGVRYVRPHYIQVGCDDLIAALEAQGPIQAGPLAPVEVVDTPRAGRRTPATGAPPVAPGVEAATPALARLRKRTKEAAAPVAPSAPTRTRKTAPPVAAAGPPPLPAVEAEALPAPARARKAAPPAAPALAARQQQEIVPLVAAPLVEAAPAPAPRRAARKAAPSAPAPVLRQAIMFAEDPPAFAGPPASPADSVDQDVTTTVNAAAPRRAAARKKADTPLRKVS